MIDRLARIISVRDHINPGNPVVTVVAAHPLTPRWLVFRVARAWFTTDPGQPLVWVKRETPGRPPAIWDITWFPPPAEPPPPALDHPQEQDSEGTGRG